MKNLWILALLGVAALPARAQNSGTNGAQLNTMMSATLSVAIQGNMQNLMMRQALERQMISNNATTKRTIAAPSAIARPGNKKSVGRPPIKRPSPPQIAVLSFARAAELTSFSPTAPSIVPAQLAKVIAPKTEDQPRAREILRGCLEGTKKLFGENKNATLPVHNVARAMAYFVVTSYAVARSTNGQRAALPDPATHEVLRRQFALTLANDARFLALGNREKQVFYETLIVLAAYSSLTWTAGEDAKNPETQKLASDFARRNLENLLGAKVEQIRFSYAGLQF